jgi:hypothetical protein
MTVRPGQTRQGLLLQAPAASADVVVALTPRAPITGSGLHLLVAPGVMQDGSSYRAKLVADSSGSGRLRISRFTAAGAETALGAATTTMSGLRDGVVRLAISLSDASAGLQDSGGYALMSYLSGGAPPRCRSPWTISSSCPGEPGTMG